MLKTTNNNKTQNNGSAKLNFCPKNIHIITFVLIQSISPNDTHNDPLIAQLNNAVFSAN